MPHLFRLPLFFHVALALLVSQFAFAAKPAAPASAANPQKKAPIVGSRIESHSASGPHGLSLNPEVPSDATHSEGPTYFEIQRKGAQWSLVFHSSDPALKLGTQKGFLIQIISPEPLGLEPALIRAEQWPAGRTEISLKAKGAVPPRTSWIQGSAAYQVCDAAQRCRPAHGTFAYQLRK